MGDSRGRWEGDTLVVDSNNFNDKTWLDKSGNYHSEELHVVERYSPIDPDHINYEVTIEDPKVLSKPWRSAPRVWTLGHEDLLEYFCTNNQDVDQYKSLKSKESSGDK